MPSEEAERTSTALEEAVQRYVTGYLDRADRTAEDACSISMKP